MLNNIKKCVSHSSHTRHVPMGADGRSAVASAPRCCCCLAIIWRLTYTRVYTKFARTHMPTIESASILTFFLVSTNAHATSFPFCGHWSGRQFELNDCVDQSFMNFAWNRQIIGMWRLVVSPLCCVRVRALLFVYVFVLFSLVRLYGNANWQQQQPSRNLNHQRVEIFLTRKNCWVRSKPQRPATICVCVYRFVVIIVPTTKQFHSKHLEYPLLNHKYKKK